jgi:hypothetical protein
MMTQLQIGQNNFIRFNQIPQLSSYIKTNDKNGHVETKCVTVLLHPVHPNNPTNSFISPNCITKQMSMGKNNAKPEAFQVQIVRNVNFRLPI